MQHTVENSLLSLVSTSSSQSTPKPDIEKSEAFLTEEEKPPQKQCATWLRLQVILVAGKKQLTGNSEELSEPLYLVNILDGSSRKMPAFPYECKIKSITIEERVIYINSKVLNYPPTPPFRLPRSRRPIFRFDLVSETWETMFERAGPPLTEYVFEVDQWLFLSWVQSFDSYMVTSLSRYDLEIQDWISNPDTSIGYRNPFFVVVDKMLYAIGGCSIVEDDVAVSSVPADDEFGLPSIADSRTLVPSVQRFNPSTSEWTQLAPLIETRQKLLCCAHNGKIYVLDGMDHPVKPSPQVYHIAEDKWEWGPSLNRVYSHPATLVVVNNTLTFIDKSRFPVLQIERLLPEKDAWEVGEDVEVKSEFPIMDAQFFPGVAKVKSS